MKGNTVFNLLDSRVRQQLEQLLAMIRPVPEKLLAITNQNRRDAHQDTNDYRRQIEDITDWIYGNWYTTGGGPGLNEADEATVEKDLSSWLKENTASSTAWEEGWVVRETHSMGYCIAGKHNIIREVFPGDYVNASRVGLPPAPGDRITVNTVRYGTDAATGFWHTESASGFPSPPLSRFYFNTSWRNAGFLVKSLSTLLETLAVPYSLKCPNAPHMFNRVDNMVVYIHRSDVATVAPQLIALFAEGPDVLKPIGPCLTKKISSAIFFADDPDEKEQSFGTSRCRALAVGIYNYLQQVDQSDGLKVLLLALTENGIDPLTPWYCKNEPNKTASQS